MAKFFLKSKNKIFKVRRKNIHWFNIETENKLDKLSVNKLLLNSIKSKKTYKNKILLKYKLLPKNTKIYWFATICDAMIVALTRKVLAQEENSINTDLQGKKMDN